MLARVSLDWPPVMTYFSIWLAFSPTKLDLNMVHVTPSIIIRGLYVKFWAMISQEFINGRNVVFHL